MRTVLINSVDDESYDRLFEQEDWRIIREDLGDSPDIQWDEVDLLFLVGAATDVDPIFYGQEVEGCNSISSDQDWNAFYMIKKAEELHIPVVGICKGAQQICVQRGGALIQDIDRVGTHAVSRYNSDLEVFDPLMIVKADHHQVMQPSNKHPYSYEVVLSSRDGTIPEHVVWSSESKVTMVGVQFHPEWSAPDTPPFDYFQNILKELQP